MKSAMTTELLLDALMMGCLFSILNPVIIFLDQDSHFGNDDFILATCQLLTNYFSQIDPPHPPQDPPSPQAAALPPAASDSCLVTTTSAAFKSNLARNSSISGE